MTNIKNNINGWLVINKPYDMGSTQVVGRLKYLLHPQKIGHAGTLDPLATGVLPIALGKATRLIPFVMDDQKVYEFDIQWGMQTDSDDLDGKIIAQNDLFPSQGEILNVLPNFMGDIMQTPSVFSALKVNGERAYDLARRGETVEIKPRQIHIYDLKLVAHTDQKSSFIARVSKGTYIRTLAHDIAKSLNMLGVVVRLHRTLDGPFDIVQAVDLNDENLMGHIQPMEVVLSHLPKLEINRETVRRIMCGQRIKDHSLTQNLPQNTPVALWCQNQIVALCVVQGDVIHPTWVNGTILF